MKIEKKAFFPCFLTHYSRMELRTNEEKKKEIGNIRK